MRTLGRRPRRRAPHPRDRPPSPSGDWTGPGPPVTRADWNRVSGVAAPLSVARPGVVASIDAASGSSRTSMESVRSRTRRAIRRLTLARMSADTIPPGRWVARTRWTPSERPTAASRTMPCTKSGSSSARTRNSSIAMTSRGSGGPAGVARPYAAVLVEVARSDVGQQPFAPSQLGRQRRERPRREVTVEVGDHTHDVRQAGTAPERRPALVVHEEEGHLVRAVGQRQGADQGLQQLRLARAGGARDQRVRPVDSEIDLQRPGRGHAEDRPGRSPTGAPARGRPTRCPPRRRGRAAGRTGELTGRP